ncbi:MAG: sigma-70 family RNA polymerase sigma factor [Bacteroidota bacterium]
MKSLNIQSKEETYLEGLRANNSKILSEIYHAYFKGIAQYVFHHGGSREDAEDVFQDAMLVLYRQAKSGQLVLTSSFYTYLYAVSKRIWLKKQGRNKTTQALPTNEAVPSTVEAMLEEAEQYELYQEKFRQLGKDCQTVLQLFFKGEKMNEIAKKMNYASEGYAKKRKFKCKQKLINLVQEDIRFQGLIG